MGFLSRFRGDDEPARPLNAEVRSLPASHRGDVRKRQWWRSLDLAVRLFSGLPADLRQAFYAYAHRHTGLRRHAVAGG